jgi:maleylacetoacetate isomerase
MVRLYGYWRSVATLRVRIALNIKGVDYEEIPIDLAHDGQHDPAFAAVNPLAAVPALVVGDGPPLGQSMAILEYLEEWRPRPPLLPADAAGRARVRAIALTFAADNHPVLTPRVVRHLVQALDATPAQQRDWVRHWFRQGLVQGEATLAGDPRTGRFCHGETLSVADIALVSHAEVARNFGVETDGLPTVGRIVEICRAEPDFERALPRHAPGGPERC